MVYLASIGLGLLVHWFWPVRWLPTAVAAPVGVVLVIAALALFVSSVRTFRNAGTPIPGNRPNPGDPDGSGELSLTVNPGQEEICYELSVSGIDEPTAAHIHDGAEGVSGPPVVTLEAPTAGSSSDCVAVERELAKEILENPAEYYVNVHNDEFPAGAVRGQLSNIGPAL